MIRGSRLIGLASRLVGAKGLSTEIFVSRLSFYTTEEELKDIFLPFGVIEEARLVREPNWKAKGIWFCKVFIRSGGTETVKAMDGRILRGRLIFVEIAKEVGLDRSDHVCTIAEVHGVSWPKGASFLVSSCRE